MRAAAYLREVGIDAEVIDPVSLAPLDTETICKSVAKTKRLIVADTAWTFCGLSAEIVAQVAERFSAKGLHPTLERIGFAPVPAPNTPALEKYFYPHAEEIAEKAYRMVHGKPPKQPFGKGIERGSGVAERV
jgi:pyruvate dehydrogenase E1 component beta subunit